MSSNVAKSFEASLLAGHKQAAVEVPFDPAEAWRIPARPLWAGRRGHRVRADCGGHRFNSAIVARSRKFWLLIDDEVRNAAGWSIGDRLRCVVSPMSGDAA